MLILGISCYYHDAAACLVRDGTLVAAAEEERFSRVKHDHRFPTNAIRFCLEFHQVAIEDVDYVVFYEKPGLKLDRVISTLGKHFPRSKTVFTEVLRNWGREKLWVSEIIQARLNVPRNKILFSEHHLSHAASSFYCSPFLEAAVLTLDGVGEWATTTRGTAHGTTFQRNDVVMFPHSIGLFYSAFTEFLGFEVNDGEYKVMGMAPYGTPRYTDKVRRLFTNISATGFELDMDYFGYETSLQSSCTKKFLDLWGEPRRREEPFYISRYARELGNGDENVPAEAQRRSEYYADVAASVQQVTEELMLDLAKSLRQTSGATNLCVAGGVAYNSAANGRILREGGYQHTYIQPGAGDSGAAIGAALAVHYAMSARPKPVVMNHVYWGKEYSDAEIQSVLDRNGYKYVQLDNENDLINRIATALAKGKVIGWFQSRFEFGPRALGNRSILADPRSVAMKETVNARIKFRELFRPFAPVTIQPYASVYYDLSTSGVDQYPYQFMLAVVPVRPEHADHLAAVTHVDQSARIQIANPETNPRYYKLIEAFGNQTGVYALLNTSFNRRGEPIVASPQDALTTFEWSAIDVLVMNSFVVER